MITRIRVGRATSRAIAPPSARAGVASAAGCIDMNSQRRALAASGPDLEGAADLQDALTQVREPDAVSASGLAGRLESAPVVVDPQHRGRAAAEERDADGRRAGVLADVHERLLGGAEEHQAENRSHAIRVAQEAQADVDARLARELRCEIRNGC